MSLDPAPTRIRSFWLYRPKQCQEEKRTEQAEGGQRGDRDSAPRQPEQKWCGGFGAAGAFQINPPRLTPTRLEFFHCVCTRAARLTHIVSSSSPHSTCIPPYTSGKLLTMSFANSIYNTVFKRNSVLCVIIQLHAFSQPIAAAAAAAAAQDKSADLFSLFLPLPHVLALS